MDAPYFQLRELVRDAGLIALSANFNLYGDMSDRMMSLAAGLGQICSLDRNLLITPQSPTSHPPTPLAAKLNPFC